MKINATFEGGNIDVVEIVPPGEARLRIRSDVGGVFRQWFYFRVAEVHERPLRVLIVNAGEASYAEGFRNYRAVASYDRQTWFRVPTHFDGTTLTFEITPVHDSIYFASFAPYSYERHLDAVGRWQTSPLVRHRVLGHTVDGRDLDMLEVGEQSPGKLKFWVVGRQHPAESMASWWFEGFMSSLLNQDDPVSRNLLRSAVFYLVPLINPDGVARGHLRTNGAGADLNREWQSPTLERSPEVVHVWSAMEQIGVDACLDVHGDEFVNHNYIYGLYAPPSGDTWAPRLLDAYVTALERLSPDFYAQDLPSGGLSAPNMTMCTQQVATRHRCLAATVEMPFHDTTWVRDEVMGYSPERCRQFGRSCLHALHMMLGKFAERVQDA